MTDRRSEDRDREDEKRLDRAVRLGLDAFWQAVSHEYNSESHCEPFFNQPNPGDLYGYGRGAVRVWLAGEES